jgi:hypothetical protein
MIKSFGGIIARFSIYESARELQGAGERPLGHTFPIAFTFRPLGKILEADKLAIQELGLPFV